MKEKKQKQKCIIPNSLFNELCDQNWSLNGINSNKAGQARQVSIGLLKGKISQKCAHFRDKKNAKKKP
jgi:hypothetical protein